MSVQFVIFIGTHHESVSIHSVFSFTYIFPDDLNIHVFNICMSFAVIAVNVTGTSVLLDV